MKKLFKYVALVGVTFFVGVVNAESLNFEGEWKSGGISVRRGEEHTFWITGIKADQCLSLYVEGVYAYKEDGETYEGAIRPFESTYVTNLRGGEDQYFLLTAEDWEWVPKNIYSVRFYAYVSGFYDEEVSANNKFSFGHASGRASFPFKIDVGDGCSYYYKISGTGAKVIRFETVSTSQDVVIPSTLGGLPVISIGDRAFSGYSSLTSLSMPDTVVKIGSSAFAGCSALTNIIVSENVKIIGDRAFYGCEGLSDSNGFVIVKNVVYDYYERDGILSVMIPDSVTSIGNSAFSGCSSLTNVIIGSCVASIEDSAFASCSSLARVILPPSVTNIGAFAFSSCRQLRTVEGGENLERVGVNAFNDTLFLYGENSWTDVETNEVYMNGYGLDLVCVGNFIVGRRGSLDEAWNPEYYDQNGNWLWQYELVIPEGTTGMADHLFEDLPITSVSIPGSVTKIGDGAFYGCTEFERVIFDGNAPETGSEIFYGVHETATAYVRTVSTGWNVDIPGVWNEIRIENYEKVLSVEDVLGEGWTSGTYGEGSVTGVDDVTYASGSSARLTAEDSSSVWLETFVTNKGVVSFDWKVSSETYKSFKIDYVFFSIDGEEMAWMGGETDWTNRTFVIGSEGVHTLRWTYTKDGTDCAGEDCAWLSGVGFTPIVELAFAAADADGGLPPEKTEGAAGDAVALPGAGTLSKSKHSFAGWSDGNSTFAEGSDYVLPGTNVTLNAVWSPKIVTSPVIDVPAEYETETTVVTISSSTEGAEIRYTLDGSEPTEESALYTGPFEVVGSVLIRAVAYMDDWFSSAEARAATVRAPWTPGECLNVPETPFEMSGDVPWIRDLSETHDGVASMRSGVIEDGQETGIGMTVSGPGNVSFWWKVSSEAYKQYQVDYVTFTVDGVEQAWVGGDVDWTNAFVSVKGEGVHILKWVYKKDISGSDGEDCAWFDEVVWTPAPSTDVTVEVGDGKSVSVPKTWFDAYGDIVAAAGGDKAAALMSTATNGRKVWECFMLGVDPTAKDDDFRITSFRMENVKPVFEFSHTTDGNGESFVSRIKTLGKAKLTDTWQEVPEAGDATFRFFTVEVALP